METDRSRQRPAAIAGAAGTSSRLRLAAGVAFLVLGLAVAARAADDVVALKNGDRISGTIVKMAAGKLVVKTSYAGEITIDWKDVASLESDTARRTKLASGDIVSVTFERKPDGTFYLHSSTLGPGLEVQPDQIIGIAVPEHPSWSGSVAASFSGKSGNSSAENWGFKGDATRESETDRWSFTARADQQTTEGTTTVQQVFARGGYDYFLSKRWFLNAFTTLEHDKLQDLILRTRVGAGPGYWFAKTDDFKLSGVLAPFYINENFDAGKDDDSVGLSVSEDLAWKIGHKRSLHQRLDLYPDLTDANNFQLQFEVGLRQSMYGNWFAEANFVDRYDNTPTDAKEKNDLLYGLALGYQY